MNPSLIPQDLAERTLAAIPTKHYGVQFRSRLEARWAAVFTAMGWRWEYEPIDLKGYIPDFILIFPAGPVLAEIKPVLTFAEMSPAMDKIDTSGWESAASLNQALVLGATWYTGRVAESDSGYYPIIGVARSRPETGLCGWYHAALIHDCEHTRVIGQLCTACPAHDDGDLIDDFWAVWNEAGNEVQWKGY